MERLCKSERKRQNGNWFSKVCCNMVVKLYLFLPNKKTFQDYPSYFCWTIERISCLFWFLFPAQKLSMNEILLHFLYTYIWFVAKCVCLCVCVWIKQHGNQILKFNYFIYKMTDWQIIKFHEWIGFYHFLFRPFNHQATNIVNGCESWSVC